MTAIVTGAVAGLAAGVFIWLVEEGIALVWHDLPDALDVDPFDSWFLLAVPAAGGLLVGIGQRVLGNYPESIGHVVTKWRTGERVDPEAAPKSFVNSLVALVAGGPVGFEAALTGILGGSATWISDNLGAARVPVRKAWGAEQIDELPPAVRQVPVLLAAVSGLFAYRWLPFGGLDLGFRLRPGDGNIEIGDGLITFAFAALLVVPIVVAFRMVVVAEEARFFQRAPVLVGVAGGLVVALLAWPTELVLFSGQEGLNGLDELSRLDLGYLVVAKWLALTLVLFAGWRGGPIFPLWLSASAAGALVADLTGAPTQMLAAAGMTAVGVVFLKGKVLPAIVLTLYAVPFAFAGAMLIGALGAAVGFLLLDREPVDPVASSDDQTTNGEHRSCEGPSSG